MGPPDLAPTRAPETAPSRDRKGVQRASFPGLVRKIEQGGDNRLPPCTTHLGVQEGGAYGGWGGAGLEEELVEAWLIV